MTPSLVSVIVVNFNRARLLEACLHSLLAQTYQHIEILVVDNGSSDDSSQVCARLLDSRVLWIPLAQNLGFAGACNVGIARSQGEYVALINNDAEADSNWLRSLVGVLQSEPTTGMCASKILFHGTGVIDKAGHLIFWDGQNRGRGTGLRDQDQFNQKEEALFPDGCAALYRKSALVEAEGFDDHFFAYADDADLGLRIRAQGWSCTYVPEAVVLHHHSSTIGSYDLEKLFLVERNRLWLALKLFPWPLVLGNPIFTLYRWGWNALAVAAGRGAAGNFRKQGSAVSLVSLALRSTWSALLETPRVLGQRTAFRKKKKLSDWEMIRLLWRYRISARALAFEDRQL